MQWRTGRQCRGRAAQRYWIVQRLGSGGMGVVYEAIDVESHRRVAIKLLRNGRTDPTSAYRALEHEADAMTLVGGSSVCRVYDLTECYGQPCLVMERLVGSTLQQRLATGPMGIRTAIDTATQIASALERIHRAGLVHQDIKPANVFITESGRIKILDFGLATTPDTRAREHAARRPQPDLPGTASYIAPERILRAPVDHRSDLFSLGAVIYEMAFGRSPFAAASSAEALFNVLENDPPPVPMLRSTAAIAVDRLARVLLEKNPARRCQSAAEVRRALTRMQADRPRTAPPTTVDRPLHARGTCHESVHARVH